MYLYQEVLIKALEKGKITVEFGKDINVREIINIQCYKILDQIREVIKDEKISDKDCFEKIEEIIRIFEKEELDCGLKHGLCDSKKE